MKPLSGNEIQSLTDELKILLGSQLQEVVTTPSGLYLSHYLQVPGRRGATSWIQIEAQQNLPFVSLSSLPPRERIKTKSPLHLFLVAHARGRRLTGVRIVPELGRAVEFCWGPTELAGPTVSEGGPCFLEFWMIPSKVNLVAKCDGLTISLRKISELKAQGGFERQLTSSVERNPEVLRAQWETRLRGGEGTSSERASGPERAEVLRDRLSQDIRKKRIALEKMRAQLNERDPARLNEVADWIRDHWSLELPEAMMSSVSVLQDLLSQSDIPKILASLYERIKKLKVQHEQGGLRLRTVQREITELESLLSKSDEDLLSVRGQNSGKLARRQADLKGVGKRLELSDSMFVVVGRSAAENLQILRDAQPWDLWIHLKDLPSAHGIIRRHRGKAVLDENLVLAIHFVLKMTPKVARNLRFGDRIEGIVAECRFVSPLKGDRLGRVTVKESRTILMKYDPQKLTRP